MKDRPIKNTGIEVSMPWDLGGSIGIDVKRPAHCDFCGKDWQRPVSYMIIKSDFDKAEFCSYNCRCAYYKKHAKKRQAYFDKKYGEY